MPLGLLLYACYVVLVGAVSGRSRHRSPQLLTLLLPLGHIICLNWPVVTVVFVLHEGWLCGGNSRLAHGPHAPLALLAAGVRLRRKGGEIDDFGGLRGLCCVHHYLLASFHVLSKVFGKYLLATLFALSHLRHIILQALHLSEIDKLHFEA